MKTKKIGMFALALLLSVATFSQKSELKAADKAVKKGDFSTATTILNGAEGLIANAEAKYQAKYYYLKGMALYANGTKPANINDAAAAFNQLIAIEKKSGNNTYSNEASTTLKSIIDKADADALAAYQSASATQDDAGYIKAAKNYERVFLLSPADTAYLNNSAMLLAVGKAYEKSNEQYQQLLDMGYTGIATTYQATSTVNGEPIAYNSQKEMNQQVKLGIAKDPKTDVSKSKVNGIIKAIATNYGRLENNEKALEFIEKARIASPNDYDLVIEEANVYYRMGNDAMFKEKLEEAIKLNPTDPNLYFNVGVMNMNLGDNEAAAISFKKAIELKPDFGDAYNNLGAMALDKAKPVQEELDANAMNFKKYDQIKAKKLIPIYREALTYYEKAHELIPDDEALKNLVNSLYENLDMDKKIE
ncbi:MAG: hypothetical protein PSN34_15465 [Urechidicola sp.]|nr:hypothetical protein [Urechidicola sp.]